MHDGVKTRRRLHVAFEIRIQGFAQEAAEVTVVLRRPLRPSAGREKTRVSHEARKDHERRLKIGLQDGVRRASPDESGHARDPNLSHVDRSPDVPPLCRLHVVLVGRVLSRKRAILPPVNA